MAPHVCCTCNSKPNKKDACMCGCGYLNGGHYVAAAQCLLILGSFFSVAALWDCAFIQIEENVQFPLDKVITADTNTLGFLTFEQSSSFRCYWYDKDAFSSVQEQVENYFQYLGSDFQLSRIFGAIGAVGGWLQFFYSISFCCSSQTRNVRYILFFLISLVLTTFQGLTLLVFQSEFCLDNGCVFNRAAYFSCVACGLYFLAGCMYLCMSDYPGTDYVNSQRSSSMEREEQTGDTEGGEKVPLGPSEELEGDEERASTEDEEAQYDDPPVDPDEVADEEKHEDAGEVDEEIVGETAAVEEKHEDAGEVEEEIVEEEIIEEEVIEEEVVEKALEPAVPKAEGTGILLDDASVDPVFVDGDDK